MKTPIMPFVDLSLQQAQRWNHLAWFLYGCIEREHVINMNAFVAWWVQGSRTSPAWLPQSPRFSTHGYAQMLWTNLWRAGCPRP